MVTISRSLEVKLEKISTELGVEESHFEYIIRNLGLLEKHHPPTAEHCVNVSLLACEIAEHMSLSRKVALYGGILHDIGKIGIPVETLSKKSGFNEEDRKIIRNHVFLGYEHLLKDGYIFSAWIALMHHRYQKEDPYPLELPKMPVYFANGTRFSTELYARLVSLADHNDALKRRNDRFNPLKMSPTDRKALMLRLNPDQPDLIEMLYQAQILD